LSACRVPNVGLREEVSHYKLSMLRIRCPYRGEWGKEDMGTGLLLHLTLLVQSCIDSCNLMFASYKL
jgi:hypothetical protein